MHRIVRATSSGWKYEFNQRHVEVILEEVELKSMRALSIPGVDEAKKTEEKEKPSPPLEPKAASAYRALAARCNCIAVDRADALYAIEVLCRDMIHRLKRRGRCLFGWVVTFLLVLMQLLCFIGSRELR